MSDSKTERLWNLHRRVLVSLIQGKPYSEIVAANLEEMNTLDYENTMVKSGNMSFTPDHQLVGAYPISPVPTDYEIEVEGIGKGFAMCAVDALGTAFTFQKTTTLRTRDKSTGDPIEITVLPDQTTPPRYKLWMTYKTKCEPGELTALAQCPTINFHSIKPSEDLGANMIVMDEVQSFKHARERFHQDTLIHRIEKVVLTGSTLDVI